jgi:hypothetical protein
MALKGDPTGPLHWGPDQEDAFQKLKQHLGEAPALALPDVPRPFPFYSHEKGGIGLGVLTQPQGPWNRLVAYLSRSWTCGLRLAPMPPGIGSNKSS